MLTNVSIPLICAQDKRLAWFDMDLSDKPYRALRYHARALRAVAVHRSYPLFASASDDGAVHVFHGMVYQARPCLSRMACGTLSGGETWVDFGNACLAKAIGLPLPGLLAPCV